MICNGDQVSKTTYSELYAVIGDSFKGAKADPTSGNFYLPDSREVALKGIGSNYAYAINNHGIISNVGGFMEDRVENHEHRSRLQNLYFQSGGENLVVVTDDGSAGIGTIGEIVTGRHGDTTEVKAVGVNYIIKATQSAVPADFISAVNKTTTGTGTRNESYISANDFFAVWYKVGRICQVDIQFNTSQELSSTEEIITGLPAPIRQVALVGQSSSNTTSTSIVIKANSAVRTHYITAAGQFCHVNATYITAE